MPPPLSLSMDAVAELDGLDDSSKPAIATRSRASLVDVDLSLAALDATNPAHPGLRACDRCRDRKVRCDRKSPRCTICVKRNETCITTPLLPHQRGGKPWTEADLALAALSPSATVAAAASGLRPQSVASSSSFGSRQQQQQGKEDDPGVERGGSSSSSVSAATAAAVGGGRSQKRPRTRTPSSAGREEATTAWAAAVYADNDEGQEEDGASTSAGASGRMRMRTGSGGSPPAAAGSAGRRDATSGKQRAATPRRRGKRQGRRNNDLVEGAEDNVPNTNTTLSPVPPGSSPFSGIMTRSPSSHADFDPPLPPQQQQQQQQPPAHHQHRRQTSTSSLQYEYGQPIADNDDDDDDEAMSVVSGAAVATPGSHYSISSSAMGEHVVIPPRIYASSSFFFGEEEGGIGADQNHLNGGRGGYDLKKRETRRALVRVLVEGREAPFDKVKLEGVDLPRLISQVELCDSAYASPPPSVPAAPPPPPHARPSSTSSPLPPTAPPSITSSTSSLPPPLFSTSRTPCGGLYTPTSHQSHLCISTYFSRLEPALELFLPGPTVAHRFLQECNAHWAAAGADANGNGNGAGDPTTTTTTTRKGWRSTYLASMAMGAMAMTEAEWASIGCTENKTQAGATWLEEAGRLLVESGFARKPTCETFRASLLVIQSCLIGLNGPPDIPVVLENLAQITAAAYELGLHVEPADATAAHSVNREGGEGGRGGNDADERRALWWRFLELQVCWAPLLDRQSSLDPASYSTLPPPLVLSRHAAQSPTTATASLKRKADSSPDATADHQLMLAQQQQQQHAEAAATALASLHAVLDFSCRAYHTSTAPRPPRPREVYKLSQRLLDLVESQTAVAEGVGAAAAGAMAELLLDVEVCRLQAVVDEIGGPKDEELEEVWKVRAARLVAANPLAGPQVSHTLAITVYLHGLVLIALRLRGDHPASETTPTLHMGMSTALETLRTAPWPLPLHQIIQRGIALLEALLPPAPAA